MYMLYFFKVWGPQGQRVSQSGLGTRGRGEVITYALGDTV